jgi:hypothetical protein
MAQRAMHGQNRPFRPLPRPGRVAAHPQSAPGKAIMDPLPHGPF